MLKGKALRKGVTEDLPGNPADPIRRSGNVDIAATDDDSDLLAFDDMAVIEDRGQPQRSNDFPPR